MCSKNVICLTKWLLHHENFRWLSRRWMSNRSYLHNRGSESLIYATLGEQLAKAAHKYPSRIAVKSVYENISITYEQLLTQADALGCALRAQGLAAGDKVGIWSHNSASCIVTLVAVARAGLISVLINPLYEKPEISYCIKKAQLKALLIGDELPKKDYYNMLSQLIPELQNSKPGFIKSIEYPFLNSIVHSGKNKLPGAFTIDSLIADYESHKDQITKYGSEVEPDDGSIVHFTSGTTGKPKAPLDSHFGVVNSAYFVGKRQCYNEEHPIICVQAPLFHAVGSVVTTLTGLTFGSTLVLPAPMYNSEANLNAFYSEKCTSTNGTPTMYVDLLKQIKSKSLDPPNIRIALVAGAPCSPNLIRDIKKYLNADTVKVKCLYGLSETTGGVFHSNYGDTEDQVAETVGYIQDHVEVKVVNTDGKTVPFGTAGELMVRGYLNMIGYLGDPEKTKEVIAAGGWLKTGDKFKISEDGYGRFVGRLKDIIVRGGENIAPKEIEDVLNTHPDILESQVVGVADERLGEELCVVLILHEGATFTHEDLKEYLTGRLAKFEIPKILKITDSFPKTTSGKIQKYKIKELVEAGKI